MSGAIDRLPEADDHVHVTAGTRWGYYIACAYAQKSGGTGSPVVLFVEPRPPIEHDPEHSDYMPCYRCPKALVRFVDDDPQFDSGDWVEPADFEIVTTLLAERPESYGEEDS